MSRREFISLLGGAAVAWPLAANAQQADEMRRIGVLIGLAEDDPETKTRLAAFRQGLERLGVCGRLSPAVAKKRGRNFAFALVKMSDAARRFLGFFFGSSWIVVLSPVLWRNADLRIGRTAIFGLGENHRTSF